MSSSNGGGAAPAAPLSIPENATIAQIEQVERRAVELLDASQTADEAEALLRDVNAQIERIRRISKEHSRRWAQLRLRVERRYGELLGPAEVGRPEGNVSGTHVSDSERTARREARRVRWDVPTDVFDDYVNNDPNPTRAGLLRLAAPNSPKREPKKKSRDTALAAVIDRLTERVRYVRSGPLAEGKRPRWVPEDCEDVELLLKAVAKRRPKYSGKRLRELAGKRQRGGLAQVQYRMMQLTGILESIDVADYEDELSDPYEVEAFHDDLSALNEWIDRSLSFASARLDDEAFERKMRKMRETSGRTPAEQRTAAALADKLERRRRENRLAAI